MSEFSEVMKQKNRMCKSILCCSCDIYDMCEREITKCYQFIHNNPKKAEEIIMRWAAKNPEPVYPTWSEWLASEYGYDLREILYNPISADIAQKLDIKPKEV